MKRAIVFALVLACTLFAGCSEEYDSTAISPTSEEVYGLQKPPGGGGTPPSIDLRNDRVYVTGGTQNGTLKVWSFSPGASPYTWSKTGAAVVHDAVVGDADNDGHLELVSLSEFGSADSPLRLEVYQPGSATPASQTVEPVGFTITGQLALGQLGGDGKYSIVSAQFNRWEEWTYDPSVSPPFQRIRTRDTDPPGDLANSVFVGDADNNAVNEILLAGFHTTLPRGGFVTIYNYPAITPVSFTVISGNLMCAKVASLGREQPNAILGGGLDKIVHIWKYEGGLYREANSIQNLGADVRDVAVADFDNCGTNEIVVAVSSNQPPVRNLSVYKLIGEKYEQVWWEKLNPKIFRVNAGDVDNDGNPLEFVVATSNGLLVYKCTSSSTPWAFTLIFSDGSVKDLWRVSISELGSNS